MQTIKFILNLNRNQFLLTELKIFEIINSNQFDLFLHFIIQKPFSTNNQVLSDTC